MYSSRCQIANRFRLANAALLLLNSIAFYLLMTGGLHLPAAESYFHSPITSEQRNRMMTVMQDFDHLMTQKNISYFIGAGTLIGSYRHLSIIPWDDDIDVFVSDADKERFDRLLSTKMPKSMSNYVLFRGELTAPAWKFYDKTSPDWYLQHSFRWPFVDIFFYRQNRTHLWHEELGDGRPYFKSKVFPLVRRPLGNLWLLAPCDAVYMLRFMNLTECQNRGFSHLFNIMLPAWRQRRIECSRLKSLYPFVERRTQILSNGDTVSFEVVKVGKSVLKNVTFRIPRCRAPGSPPV